MVLISLRVPKAMRDELRRLARESGQTRAEVHRAITAEGIRRARIAGTYTARFAGRLRERTGE